MTVITEATFVEGQFDDVEGELLIVHLKGFVECLVKWGAPSR